MQDFNGVDTFEYCLEVTTGTASSGGGGDTGDGDTGGAVEGPLSLTKTTFDANEAIVVNYAGLPGNSKDWIGTYVAGTAHNQYLDWEYSGGAASPAL
jgi:hypothetical protein